MAEKSVLPVRLDPEALECLRTLAEEEAVSPEKWAWEHAFRSRTRGYIRTVNLLLKGGKLHQPLPPGPQGAARSTEIVLGDLAIARYDIPPKDGANVLVPYPTRFLETIRHAVAIEARSMELLKAPELQQANVRDVGTWARNVLTDSVVDAWTKRDESAFDEQEKELFGERPKK